jgi:hypothetical protein
MKTADKVFPFSFPFSFFLFLFFAKSLLYVEETKAGKYIKPDREGWRKEGNDLA